MLEHLSSQDYFICLLGIVLFWFFRFSSDKDEADDKEEDFNKSAWVKNWIKYKWDNIMCHLLASFFFLYLGEENLQAWLGDVADQLPSGANQLGSSAIIGFFGSFVAEFLKKLVRLVKT